MEKLSSFHGLVIVLAFSHLIDFSHAVPSTRAQRMMQETGNHGAVTETAQEYVRNERMDLDINDYPGSSANDRHTPRPPERS
ncbi:uncharacterized protein [Elaeis guineensis]|uniref:Uncharacterized protein LOC105041740 isoform X2 n=1 Tax=Elaeis guineensis var. tenera TaxID=51953 RepID=A0A6I9QXT2_ELAGV|nr:uncharacterized protein LOC105041740 isoform X2 [Elaeis guineensis]